MSEMLFAKEIEELETDKRSGILQFKSNLQVSESIDSLVVEEIYKLYKSAREQRLSDPERALEDSQKALKVIDQSSETAFDNSMLFAYARGMFYLLIASIYLNEDTETSWLEAVKNYLLGKEEFHSRSWSYLAAWASWGLVMAYRKLGKFEEAMNACNEAKNSLGQESIPSSVNTHALREAIEEECSKMQDIRERPPESAKRWLPVFNILAGEGRVAIREVTTLNLLSRADYRLDEVEEVFVDLTEYPNAREADYILEIDAQARTEDGLKPGDWLFVQDQRAPDRLHGETVAVLVDEGQGTMVGLKVCLKADDHYFLKAKGKDATSVIIVNHTTSPARIRDLDLLYYEKKVIKRTDDVQVSGPVIDNGHTLRQAQSKTTGAFFWRIPQISNISAGLGYPIAEENIEAYVNLRERKSIEGATYFVLVVDGDRVLIRQQEGAKNKDIAAVVINTPTTGPIGVLKRYYVVAQEDEAMRHWLLESSNPANKHLVVMPDGADAKAIRAMYGKVPDRKFEFYENAELTIAGVYVKTIEDNNIQVSGKVSKLTGVGRYVEPIRKSRIIPEGPLERSITYPESRIQADQVETVQKSDELLVDFDEFMKSILVNQRIQQVDVGEIKDMLQRLPFAGLEILGNFEGFVLVEIPGARKKISSDTREKTYVLSEKQSYELRVTIQSGKPLENIEGFVGAIRLIDGKDVEAVTFIVDLDCDNLKLEPDKFQEFTVPTKQAKPITKAVNMIAEKEEPSLFVEIFQKNTLVQVISLKLEIE